MKEISYNELIDEAKRQEVEKFVVGVVVQDNQHILLLQRLPDDSYPNMYEIPGGEVEEETLENAVERELKEETGLELLEMKQYVGHFDYESGSGKKVRQFNFLVRTKDTEVKWHPEHTQYAWVRKEMMNEFPMTSEMSKTVASIFENWVIKK